MTQGNAVVVCEESGLDDLYAEICASQAEITRLKYALRDQEARYRMRVAQGERSSDVLHDLQYISPGQQPSSARNALWRAKETVEACVPGEWILAFWEFVDGDNLAARSLYYMVFGRRPQGVVQFSLEHATGLPHSYFGTPDSRWSLSLPVEPAYSWDSVNGLHRLPEDKIGPVIVTDAGDERHAGLHDIIAATGDATRMGETGVRGERIGFFVGNAEIRKWIDGYGMSIPGIQVPLGIMCDV